MKRPERKSPPRSGPPIGSRTGPRARAAADQWYGDPYKRTERPDRPPRRDGAPPPRRDGASLPRLRVSGGSSGGGIALDPDVARVFRTSAAVNEALRMVIRLARLAGGSGRPPAAGARPPTADRRPAPRFNQED